MNRILLALALFVLAIASFPATAAPPDPAPAQAAPAPAKNLPLVHRMFSPADLKWVDGPPSLPKGARVAVLQGDPKAPGLFTMRIALPAGYRVPPHWHPADEHVTVVSGTFSMALGEAWDETKGHAMTAGSFSIMPAGLRHFAWTTGETVVQVHALGPWGITYVNPQDDPRNPKQAGK